MENKENIDLFKLKYVYTIGSLKKLQEMHENGALELTLDKDFNEVIAREVSKEIDVALCVLWACQVDTDYPLEFFYKEAYKMPQSVSNELKKLCYYAVRLGFDPVGFMKAHKEWAEKTIEKLKSKERVTM